MLKNYIKTVLKINLFGVKQISNYFKERLKTISVFLFYIICIWGCFLLYLKSKKISVKMQKIKEAIHTSKGQIPVLKENGKWIDLK